MCVHIRMRMGPNLQRLADMVMRAMSLPMMMRVVMARLYVEMNVPL